MKNLYLKKVFTFLVFFLLLLQTGFSQCTAGWSGTATIKWDNRNYLITTGTNAGFVTAAMSTSQNFAIGTSRVNIAMAGGITTAGQNTSNTANAGSFGSGASVSYYGQGTITLTFDTLVQNVKFSLYDIDKGQVAKVTAQDAAATAQTVTMANVTAGTVTIAGSPGTAPTASASGAALTNTDTHGSVNVTIPAAATGVKTVVITLSNTSDSLWLSDISACVYSAFPTSYYIVSKPYTGQPAYILANSNNYTASMTDIASGKCRYIFQDHTAATTNNTWLNSFGYDPYNHMLYYTYDGTTTPSTNKAIKKYDFSPLTANNASMSSGTISTILADVGTLGIPIFDQGLESGAMAYYGGSLYLGVEGSNAARTSKRYSMIWRIDFTAGVPTKACEVFAAPADNGSGTITHDWGDIVISNGVLYDFNSAGSSITTSSFIHYDLQTGLITSKTFSITPIPGQNGVGWDEQVYWLSSSKDSIAKYNYAGSVNWATKALVSGPVALDWTTPGAGDGSEAFKPPLDYGDAPATFDPVIADPAAHDYDSTLKLGLFWNPEFAKKTTVDASGDGATDDGVSVLPVFTHAQNYYDAYVKVYNHSGAPATLVGWIDFNNDGVFQAGEGSTPISIPVSSTNLQTIHVAWGPVSTIPLAATYVFMRMRLTSSTNTLTASTPTGYLSNGEVEDYKINIDDILPVKLISFKATAVNNATVNLQWIMASEMNMKQYIVERSDDEINWLPVVSEKPDNNPEGTRSYEDNDNNPLSGRSYYRLKMVDYTGAVTYSEIDKVDMDDAQFSVAKITPNPFQSTITIKATLPESENMIVNVIDASGKSIRTYQQFGNKGKNTIVLDNLGALIPGVYVVEVIGNGVSIKQKLVKE